MASAGLKRARAAGTRLDWSEKLELFQTKYFCAVYDYAQKAAISKGCWGPERTLELSTHFSGPIKLQHGEKCNFL